MEVTNKGKFGVEKYFVKPIGETVESHYPFIVHSTKHIFYFNV